MRVERLTAVNVKRIEEINIAPAKDAHLVIIGGNNGQGKTSALDAIECAIGGGRSLPDRIIREGEGHAEVLVDLGEWTVTRRWWGNSAKQSEVRIEKKDGSIVKRPQAWLDALFSNISFDVMEFSRMAAKQQFETLRDMTGLNLGPLEGERQRVYDERTDVNRQLKHAKGQLEGFPLGLDSAPDEAVSIANLVKQEARIRLLATEMKMGQEQQEKNVAEIRELTKKKEKLESQSREIEARRHEIAEILAELPTIDEANSQIANAEKTNERVRLKKERAATKEAIAGYQSDERRLTQKLADIDREKAEAIAAANFPIDGLALEDGRVLYNGVPFDQAAESQKLRVSVAIGLAMNPKLKVLLIRDGALLDLDSLEEVRQMATDAGAQIFIERVGKAGPVSYVIEDGKVAEEVAR